VRTLFATATVIAALAASAVVASPVRGDEAFLRDANDAADRVAREDGFSGVVLVARGDHVLVRKAEGFADRARQIAITPETKFRIESISKQFAATAILLLVQDGKLSLSDSIAKYVPLAPHAWNRITIEQLLTHSAGIHSCDCGSQADFIRAAEAAPLDFAPGTDFRYSNAGYALLGAVVARVSGRSYPDFMRSRIFAPLGMRRSRFGWGSNVKGYVRSVSSSREEWKDGQPENPESQIGFGGIYSTVDDILIWERALRGDRLLSAASRKAMFTDYGHNYGFGWRFASKLGHAMVWHTGANPDAGFASIVDTFPADGLTVVALTNNTGLTNSSATLTIAGKTATFPAIAARKLVDEIESLYFTGTS
jgi:CubicO group peptidase (beta-lactamase class C family)